MTTQEAKRVVGENIKRLRSRLDRSVADLAEATGIARAYWYEAENGTANVTIGTLEQIAGALNVSVRDLFTEPLTVFAQDEAPKSPKKRKGRAA